MATKKPAAKKVTAKSSKSKTARRISPEMLYRERHPENHRVSGKYKFFYITFACTTIFFAALSVWLFVFASEIMNKYESVEACTRAHTRCDVTVDENGINAKESK